MKSLATRCTACGTIFRIVEDQLRVSDGWVRCGRCAEVFDAREMLFDIERDAPPPWPRQPFMTPPEAEPEPEPEPAVAQPPDDVPTTQFLASDWGTSTPPPQEEPEFTETPPAHWSEQPESRQEPRWVDAISTGTEPPAQWAERSGDALAADVPAQDAAAANAALPMPEFMRRAQSDARWRRPGVRIALGLTSVLLATLLSLQITMHFRDALAAAHPPMRASLAALCAQLGCEIQPWRRIEALSIDSTSLNPVGGNNNYRLSLSLRNKTGVEVAAPAVELSLTDAGGAAFARRVLTSEMLSPVLKQVGADSEQPLTFNFSSGSQRITGYTVNIFYP